MNKHIIISGAGIAGAALAHEITQRGWTATVLERYPDTRSGGQNIDIRGAAREVIKRMGIEEAVREANTTEIGTRFVRADGSIATEFPLSSSGKTDGLTAELEILRSELSRILIERSCSLADYRYDTTITEVTDHGDHVTVALNDGSSLDGDVLIIAEGLRSRSRRFVTSTTVTDFSMYFAYATVPRRANDEKWWLWQAATKSRALHLRPDNLGTMRAFLTFFSDVRGFTDLDRDSQVTILRKTFQDVGGLAPRILEELEAGAPLYFSVVGKVNSPRWSKGRIALLGDSAFCNVTFGGAGTSLALIGAYILAGELATSSDHLVALENYARLMKPFVTKTPKVQERMLRLMNPRSGVGVRILNIVLRITASPLYTALSRVFERPPVVEDTHLLPTYPARTL